MTTALGGKVVVDVYIYTYIYVDLLGLPPPHVAQAIREMRVRGAPAIAIVGVLSLVIELRSKPQLESLAAFATFVEEKLAFLVTARSV